MSSTARHAPQVQPDDHLTMSAAEPDVPVILPEEIPLPATFAELNLAPAVLESILAAGFVKPTPIQAQFIPVAMTGRDVMGQAKTGTGKTAAFLLPIFQRVKPGEGSCQAFVLAPTRELAMQIHGEIGRLGTMLGFSSITLYGGASYEPQIEALSNGVDIVVGTPGRVMDHMRSHRLDLSGVKIAVLDEADRMLDLGFRKDIEYILRHCPASRQTLLLSATIPDDIKKLSSRFMNDPLEVWTAPENLTVDKVEQHFFVCNPDEKLPILLKLLDVENPPLAIVFCATKIGAKKLAARLKRLYINAREIHGDLQQARREKIMGRFRTGEVRLLIATDVASRGIDVQNITHIFNYDIPYKIEDYVHRIGRTGRMEKSGKAYTFVTRDEGSYLTEIELLINREIIRAHFDDLTSKWWPNPPAGPEAEFQPDDAQASDYISTESGGGGGGGGGSGKRRRRRRGSDRGDRSDRGARGDRGDRGDRTGSSEQDSAVRNREDRQTSDSISSGDSASESANSDQLHANQNREDTADGPAGERSRSRTRRRRKKEPFQIVCSQCGTQATVNFKPKIDRPVYCNACFQARKPTAEVPGNVPQSSPAAVDSPGSGDTNLGADLTPG